MAARSPIPTQILVSLVALGVMWGGAFTLIKALIDTLSAVEMAAGRLTLGAAAVAVFLVVQGQLRWPSRSVLLPITVVALLDTLIPYTLVGWAESRIDSGVAAVLISAMPLFTVILAAGVFRQETAGPLRLAGLAIGFVGVLTIFGGPSALTGDDAVAEMAVLGAAASYAVAALLARRVLRHIDAANFTVSKLGIGAVLASVATLATGGGGGFIEMGASDHLALVVLGVFCTGVTFVLYFRVVGSIGSVGASTVTYIIPVFALLFGAIFLDERIGAATVAGMALIITGVAAVMFGPLIEAEVRRALRRQAPATA